MKLVRMMLIGSALIAAHLLLNVGSAEDSNYHIDLSLQAKALISNILVTPDDYSSFYSDKSTGLHSPKENFLVQHNFSNDYIFGVKYANLDLIDDLRDNEENSRLWILMQFKF